MQELTAAGRDAITVLASRFSISPEAVHTLLYAVHAGGGQRAEFYHPELGGGRWTRGGEALVGDTLDPALNATVGCLCAELAALLSASHDLFLPVAYEVRDFGGSWPSGGWWPSDLGLPSVSDVQGEAHYAYFPQTRRFALKRGSRVTVYDTLDHAISEVHRSGRNGLGFVSQRGAFPVEVLPIIRTELPLEVVLPEKEPAASAVR